MTAVAPPQGIFASWYPEINVLCQRSWYAYQLCPFVVSSWWRSIDDNERVGGNEYSQHLIGTAFDAVPQAGYTVENLTWAIRRAGLTAVPYPTHVHAQLLPSGWLRQWALGRVS